MRPPLTSRPNCPPPLRAAESFTESHRQTYPDKLGTGRPIPFVSSTLTTRSESCYALGMLTAIVRIRNWFRRTFLMGKRPALAMRPEVEAKLFASYDSTIDDRNTHVEVVEVRACTRDDFEIIVEYVPPNAPERIDSTFKVRQG